MVKQMSESDRVELTISYEDFEKNIDYYLSEEFSKTNSTVFIISKDENGDKNDVVFLTKKAAQDIGLGHLFD